MPTYTQSRLEASGPVANCAYVRCALEKSVRTTPNEKLMMEAEAAIPRDVTDIGGNKRRVAEVVAKLVNKLKEGPLKKGKNDQERLDKAIHFLVTKEGKAWTQSWFQPQIAAIDSASTPTALALRKVSIVAAGKANMMPNFQLRRNTQLENQGGTSHGAGVQLREAPANIIVLLLTPIGDSSAIAPAGTTPRSMVSRSTALRIGSSHLPTSAPGPSSIEMNSATAIKPSSLIKEVDSALSLLSPRISQHQRSYSDPSQVSLCLPYYTIHGMSYGGPFQTTSSSSEAVSTTRGMQIRRNARNERWMVYVMIHVLFNIMAWALFIVFLVQLRGATQCTRYVT